MPATLSPAPSPSTAQSPQKAGWTNFILENFHKGGPIMWPILIVSIIGVAVVLERIFWWTGRWMRRDPKRIEKVFTAIETGDVAEASRLSRGSRDPVLRMMWNGLNHQHASLQGALQVAAGIEIKRAGRFLVVMDTLVTLAPLLGLLGTITGLIRSFSFLGNEELAVQAVTGGIAEALIATACGLGIADGCDEPGSHVGSSKQRGPGSGDRVAHALLSHEIINLGGPNARHLAHSSQKSAH
jgi:biopolymer transport protein ExbB